MMKLGDTISAFDEGGEWLDAIAYEPHAGRPLLVHFWSTGCPLCHEGAARISEWRDRHRPDALDIVAVFAPRPESTSIDLESVRRDARDLMRVDYPCAIDRRGELRALFECPFSPGYFVFDRDGKLRHRQMGNDGLDVVGALLDRLTVKASPSSGA